MQPDYWQEEHSALQSTQTWARGVTLLHRAMRTGCVRGGLLFLSIGLVWSGVAAGYESTPLTGSIYHATVAGASSLYELADPLPANIARWDPLADSRLELSTGLLPGHEILVASTARGTGWAGSEVSFSGVDTTWGLDP